MNKLLLYLFLITALILPAGIALAAWGADIVVIEDGTASHEMLACNITANIDYMEAEGYIGGNGTDTLVVKGGDPKPHMLADDRIMLAIPVAGNSTNNLSFTSGNTPLDSFYTIPGEGGSVDVTDADNLELSANFTIEQSGWWDTAYSGYKTAVHKEDAFTTYIASTGNITSLMGYPALDFDGTDDYVHANSVTNGGFFGGAFTVMAWGRMSDWTGNGAVWAGGRTDSTAINTQIHFNDADNKMKAASTAGGSSNIVLSATTYDNDTDWHFFALVVDVEGYKNHFIIDSTDHGNDSTGVKDLSSISHFYLGQLPYTSANVNPWEGEVKEVWVFGRELSPAEIEEFRIGNYADLTSIEARFQLYEATGTVASDTSGQSNDGTVVGATWKTLAKVSATGITSGEYIMTTSANGSHMWIEKDGATQEIVALGGASVPDTTDDWTFYKKNVLPYSDNTSISVNETLQMWFRPNDIISGTTLPDRATSVANDGTFTWGSNRSGVSISLGALISDYVATVAPGLATPDIVPTLTPPVSTADAAKLAGLTDHPLTPAIHAISEITGIYELLWWWFGTLVLGLLLFGVSFKWVKNLMLSGALFCAVIGYGITIGIYDFWVIFAIIVILLGCVVLQNRRATG